MFSRTRSHVTLLTILTVALIGASPVAAAGELQAKPLWTFDVPQGIYNLDSWGDGYAVADLDYDGTPDVVFGTRDGQVTAVSGKTGKALWRQKLADKAVNATADIRDLDGDGHPEVIATAMADPARIQVLDRHGQELWTADGDFAEITDLAYADVTGNGLIDIVGANNTYPYGGCVLVWNASDGKRLHAFHAGRPLSLDTLDLTFDGVHDIAVGEANRVSLIDVRSDEGWTMPVEGPGFGADIVAADVSGDGRPEMLSGGSPTTCYGPEGRIDWMSGGRHKGTLLSVADVVNDEFHFRHRIEVVASDRDSTRLTVMDGMTGEVMWSVYGVVTHVLGNVNQDGLQEILIGAFNPLDQSPLPHYYVGALDGDLNPLWAFPLDKIDYASFSLVAADLDNDPQMEVVVANGDTLMALDVRTRPLRPAPEEE